MHLTATNAGMTDRIDLLRERLRFPRDALIGHAKRDDRARAFSNAEDEACRLGSGVRMGVVGVGLRFLAQ